MKLRFIYLVTKCYRFFFARRQFYPLNRLLHALSLRGLGVLNFENDGVSGESHFLNSYLGNKRGSTVLDVGGNTGRYAEKVLKLQSDARVFSFEPHPITFSHLQEVARKYGFEAFNVGCGSSKGEGTLYDYPGHEGSEHATVYQGVFTGIHNREPFEHKVRLITLDDFVVEHDVKEVDLLKIDVEGNEMNVLKGFQKYISQGKVKAIHFEFNTMNVVSRVFFKDFFDLLTGYSFYRMLPNGLAAIPQYDPTLCEIFAFQNIVAIRNEANTGTRE